MGYAAVQPPFMDCVRHGHVRRLSAPELLLERMEERDGGQVLQPERFCHVSWCAQRCLGRLDACVTDHSNLWAENEAQDEDRRHADVRRWNIVREKLPCFEPTPMANSEKPHSSQCLPYQDAYLVCDII